MLVLQPTNPAFVSSAGSAALDERSDATSILDAYYLMGQSLADLFFFYFSKISFPFA